MSNILFKGIMPALISPLDENGSVKEKALRKLINWHLNAGCTGFYICGATGEGVVMKPETRREMAEITVDEVKGRGTVIDHIGAIDLRTASELARHASDTGVDAISSVPPFFYKYGEKEIIDYYKAIAESSDKPILIYACPLSGPSMTVDMVKKIMSIEKVIGLKWTSYNYYDMFRIKELNNGDINVINGPDETLLCGLTMGADGGIGSTYNIMPKVFTKIYDSFVSGNFEDARNAQFKANKLIELLIKYGVICGIKDILRMLGIDAGYSTYPMKRFTSIEQDAFRAELKSLNYIEEYL
jgi:N-acetylneuraminate lyase